MVEPPGIAPGSGPLITSAFIAISGASPGKTHIGAILRASKAGCRSTSAGSPGRLARAFADRAGFAIRQGSHAVTFGTQSSVVMLGGCGIGGVLRRQAAIFDVMFVHAWQNGWLRHRFNGAARYQRRWLSCQ